MPTVDIDRTQKSWASIEMRLNGGAPVIGFKGVKYSWKIERALVQGAGRKPMGMTRGKFVPQESTITFYEDAYRQLTNTPGWADRVYTLTVQYADPGEPIHTDTIIGVRFGGGDGGGEEGTDPLAREVPFMFTGLLLNGVDPIDAA